MTQDDYGIVTETPGIRASREQLSMLLTRYQLAADRADGRDVCELACGAGLGVEYLARRARRVLGGDIDAGNLGLARRICARAGHVALARLDAQRLPLADASCDLLCCFEAVYYLPEPRRFVAEARRVLRPGGELILGSVNCQWPGFNPSPYSRRYLSAGELVDLLREAGFAVDLRVGFADRADTLARRMLGALRRLAVAARLIPRSMKGKELLKRLVMGPLAPIPERLEVDMAELEELEAADPDAPQTTHKMLYCLGRAPGAQMEAA